MKKDFLETILAEKKIEIQKMPLENVGKLRETYSFTQFLKENATQLQLLGEVKKASPSLGAINLEVDVVNQAKSYEKAGVAGISVLTDPVFFKGSIEDLRKVAEQVKIPVLNKDFILHEKQIIRALNAGASMILLIVAALPVERLQALHQFATTLGLEVLVEVHDLAELKIAEQINASLIGVNNRDLKSFEVTIQTSVEMAKHFETDAVYLSESGIKTVQDAQLVAPYFHGILVGETLMKSENPELVAKNLRVKR